MLKSLELFGFKSFADRTRFDFAPGITCVVGPNGSGKSNVVDALKWILGDQSAKSLRGKEMTDVIFNGSAGRKPSAFAEATLTFDNSNGWLAIDAQEVQIGRRIWRSGDAEYLINRAPARLKDIRDLFLGTGSSAYSIIEQGRVDQILQANPTSRRLVFEEAAGISRYKARKVDAQRKLERVAQNLLRLTDIVDEVEAQLNSTRSQAAKATKYREISEELRRWWHGLAADDYRHLTAELDQLEQKLADQSARLEVLTEQQRQIEERDAAFDAEISAVDDRLREVERRSTANRETIAGHEATIQYQTARLEELEGEFARLQKQQRLLRGRAQEAVIELERATSRWKQSERDYEQSQSALTACDDERAQLADECQREREQLERDRQRQLELMRDTSQIGGRVSTLQSQQQAVLAQKRQAIEQRQQLDLTIAECRAERDRRQQRLDEHVQAHAAAQENLREVQSRRSALLGEQDEFKRRLAEAREQRSAWQARRGLLEDLELRQEGLGIGVKEILSRAKTSQYPPWNSILGSVADLLDVDVDRAALLEVALGNRAQLIVLKELQPFLDYLSQGTCTISGRVGFVALDEPSEAGSQTSEANDSALSTQHSELSTQFAQPAGSPLSALHSQPGVVMRADGLVQTGSTPPGLAERLLSDTWIVDTLEHALQLSSGVGRGCRFVTLQGEVVESNGTLFVGTVRSETAIVSRKSELRRLKNDLLRLDRQIEEQERQLASLYETLTGADEELETAAAALDRAAEQIAQSKSELVAQEQELERLRRDRQALTERIEASEAEAAQIEQSVRLAEVEFAQTEEALRTLQAALSERERELAYAEQRLQQLEQRRNAEQLELAKQEERLEAVRAEHARIADDLHQRELQRDEADRRLEANIKQRRQMTLHVLNASAELAELFLVREQLADEAAGFVAEKSRLRQQRAQIADDQLRVRKERRELADHRHAAELRAREIRHQIATLEQRLEEEDQLNLSELAATGISAFELYLDERRAPEAINSPENRDTEPDQDDADAPEQRVATLPDEELTFPQVRAELEARVSRLRRKLKLMGHVNTDSLRDLEELEDRYGHLSSQLQDLVEAKNALEDIIRRINAESKRLFTETFETIRRNFQDLFRKVFGGGDGDLVLEDPDDILECGIDVVARPPGKELRSITLLSGGEKTMTAIALIMAIFKSRPSPFCILDEVDAALDEANVERYTGVVKEFQHSTQFIMITHHKRSMVAADVLYGVTMEESGVSKRMSVRFEDVSENGEFKTSGGPEMSANQAA